VIADPARRQHTHQGVQRVENPAGCSLKIEVIDIDLPGRFGPFRFRLGSDAHVVRDMRATASRRQIQGSQCR
jgi:hypothetical protein